MTNSIYRKFFAAISMMFAIQAHAVDLGPLQRDSSGNPVAMPQAEAADYCESQGQRLPTSREYAEYIHTLGGQGIRETSYPGAIVADPRVQEEMLSNRIAYYFPVYKYDYSPGYGIKKIDFYLNSKGFHRSGPDDEFASWSSSKDAEEIGSSYAYEINGALWGYHGTIAFAGVRCISDTP